MATQRVTLLITDDVQIEEKNCSGIAPCIHIGPMHSHCPHCGKSYPDEVQIMGRVLSVEAITSEERAT